MKKSVLVDIDNTLADTQVKMIEFANSKSAKGYTFGDMNREFRKMKDPEWLSLVRDFLQQPELVVAIEPYQDALGAMRRLHKAGYMVQIASARKENLHSTTAKWLKQHGFIDYVTEVHGRHSRIPYGEFKSQTVDKVKAVAAFDDSLDVVETLAKIVPTVYLIDQPWNQTKKLPSNVVRAGSFSKAVDLFLGAGSRQ